MALTAYFDDSRESWQGRSFYTLAGYVANTDFWNREFEPTWRRYLETAGPSTIKEFKSNNLGAVLSGEFKHWSREDADQFIIRAVDEMVNFPAGAFLGVGCVVFLGNSGDAEIDKGVEEASLGCCFINLVGMICRILGQSGRRDPIHVICDEQDEFEPRFRRIWNDTIIRTKDGCPFDLSQLDFASSEKLSPLQAADLLVGETRKDLKNRMDRPHYPVSRALQRLITRHPHIALCLDSDFVVSVANSTRSGEPLRSAGFHILYNTTGFELGFTGEDNLPYVEDPRPIRKAPG